MNTNAKKRKPEQQNKAAPAAKPAPKNPQETSARRRQLRKQRKLKKIKVNMERINDFRIKIKAGDAEIRKEVEKTVTKLRERNSKSKRGHRKLNMYNNILSGKFSMEKRTPRQRIPRGTKPVGK
ncbi:hypothetical protein RN001_011058 [Aquatica leii]|uniref:Uncharacterized protein n=1 Tax=Aquatica leii TaxID=1421715 RepID=A0AAN7SEU6_9COLE|nr:hypothetical protein RN001_011058 [Aquatica leii]